MTKQCRRCLLTKPATDFPKNPRLQDGLHSYCKACQNASVKVSLKQWREKNKSYWSTRRATNPLERKKANARNTLNNAIHSGKLERLPCIICMAPKAEAHHNNYNLPLQVLWLCKQHHEDIHHKHKELALRV
jgi:hypothetical protein